MKISENIAHAVYRELFIEMLAQYKKNLDNKIDEYKESSFCKVKNIFSKLDKEEKLNFLNFIKLVMADSVSTIFGVLDGTTFIEGLDEDFIVSYGGAEVQGYLQDYFIQKIEEEGGLNYR